MPSKTRDGSKVLDSDVPKSSRLRATIFYLLVSSDQ